MPEQEHQTETTEQHEQHTGETPEQHHDQTAEHQHQESETDDGEEFDKERAMETIRKQREAEKELSKRVKSMERELKKYENEKLSEQERLQRELEELRTERDTAVSEKQQLRAQTIANGAGAKYPDLLIAKIPAEALEDEDLTKEAINKLKSDYPDLFRSTANGSADGGAGTRAVPRMSMNDLIRRKAGRT